MKKLRNEQIVAKNEFQAAKEAHAKAAGDFKARLDIVKSDNLRKGNERKNIAQRAGIPSRYLDNIRIAKKPDGTIQIYFGGIGKPDGPGHGHYTVQSNSEVTHAREPFTPHGPQNFTDSKRDYFDIVMNEVAGKWEFGFNCSFRGYPAFVESGYSQDGRDRKIDIFYGPNGPFGPGHHHAGARIDNPLELLFDKIR